MEVFLQKWGEKKKTRLFTFQIGSSPTIINGF